MSMDFFPGNWGNIISKLFLTILMIAQPKMLEPKTFTQSPIVTGTSVLAIKYDKGVIVAADNLGMLL